MCVPAATFSGSSENLGRPGVRSMERTRCNELFVFRIPSRTPSLRALLRPVEENRFFVVEGSSALGGEKRFFAEGDRSKEGPNCWY